MLLPDAQFVLEALRDDCADKLNLTGCSVDELWVRWAWFVLPMRYGYPAVDSIVAELGGNESPYGPAHKTTWNRVADAPNFPRYRPHRYSKMWWTYAWSDNFNNDWGFFNAPWSLIAIAPPVDAVVRFVFRPIRALFAGWHSYFVPGDNPPSQEHNPAWSPTPPPFRTLGLAASTQYYRVPDDMALLVQAIPATLELRALIQQFTGRRDRFVLVAGGEGDSAPHADNAWGRGVRVDMSVGRDWMSEHVYQTVGTTFSTGITPRDSLRLLPRENPEFRVAGDLTVRDYRGSLRFNLSKTRLHSFLKGGYGYTWYEIRPTSLSYRDRGVGLRTELCSESCTDGPFKFGRKPFAGLPNLWTFGAGFEFLIARNPGGLDGSLRAEYEFLFHDLGFEDDFDGASGIKIGRQALTLSLSLSY